MIRSLLSLLLGLFAMAVSAQTVHFSGKVVDSLNTPIQFANVIAQNTATDAISGFAVTDADGAFKLALPGNSSYLLKVSFVGFLTFEKSFEAKTEDFEHVIIELQVANDLLNEVQVVHEMPVTMSGDTLIYKTDAFTNGRERKLEDVLGKLPGMEVDENGEVKVQGKKVNKVMVDGKQFFDGDTKMATKNLPANAVDRVQVLKDYNEVGPMDGLRGEDNLALNIQLKEGKKNLLFGDVTLGGGPENRYVGHANLFYYSPKTNVNLIADANNIGEQAFTMQDYFRFSGGLSSIAGNSGTSMRIANDDLGFPIANRESAQDLETKLGALNFNYNPNKRWSHSGFFIGSDASNTFGSLSQRRYLRDDITSEELLETTQQANNLSGLLKYSATYTPKKETYVRYSAFGKLASQENVNSRNSTFSGIENQISEYKNQEPLSVDQQLEWYHTPNEKNVFSWEGKYAYQYQNPDLQLRSNQALFEGVFPIVAADWYQLQQQRDTRSHESVSAFNYYRILNRTNHINLSVGHRLLDQSYQSNITQQLDEGINSFDSTAFQNDNAYRFWDVFAALSYKTKLGPLVVSPALYLHQYALSDTQMGEEITDNPTLLLPSIYAKWGITSVQTLSFRYGMEANFADVQRRALGYTISDYNALWSGNRGLTHGVYHNVNLYYNYFNFFAGMDLYGNLTYQLKVNDFANYTRFEGLERINSVFNSEPINEQLNGMFRVGKRFHTFKVKGSAELTAFRTNNVVDEEVNQNESLTQRYSGSLSTTFFKQLDLEGGYKHQLNQYSADNAQNTFTTYNPYGELNWDLFKRFHLQTDYQFNAYENQGSNTTSQFSIWNAYLRYHKASSAWEVKVAAYNLLNTKGVRRDSFNENLISSYEYYIQPRYFVLSLRYEI